VGCLLSRTHLVLIDNHLLDGVTVRVEALKNQLIVANTAQVFVELFRVEVVAHLACEPELSLTIEDEIFIIMQLISQFQELHRLVLESLLHGLFHELRFSAYFCWTIRLETCQRPGVALPLSHGFGGRLVAGSGRVLGASRGLDLYTPLNIMEVSLDYVRPCTEVLYLGSFTFLLWSEILRSRPRALH
jgi:hypothetical protein